MEDLTEVITASEFHPHHCNLFVYSSSKGSLRLCDMRASALCDKHSKRELLVNLSVKRCPECCQMCPVGGDYPSAQRQPPEWLANVSTCYMWKSVVYQKSFCCIVAQKQKSSIIVDSCTSQEFPGSSVICFKPALL
ncbi:UNVERIFIED_CONTAM: hypothetical protein K2H54_060838 [Gekko kuhli]